MKPKFQEIVVHSNQTADNLAESFRVQKILATAVRDLAKCRTEDSILQLVVNYTHQITGAKLTVIFTPDPDGWLCPRAQKGEELTYLQERHISVSSEITEGHGLAGAAFQKGRTLCYATDGLCPAETDPIRWLKWQERAITHGFGWLVLIPLCYKNQTWGLLNFYTSFFNEPSLFKREAVENMALVAASALYSLSLQEETIFTMTKALEARDDETQAHARRVVLYTERLAKELLIHNSDELQFLRWGALLHDIGKIGLSDAVLRKPGSLTDEEWQTVKRHPQIGYDMLQTLHFLGNARQIVLAHHERWDGFGYPSGLRGEKIPFGARIFAVVDAFDAMTSDRPYRNAMSFQEAHQELYNVAGTQLDPKIVHTFCKIKLESLESLRRHTDRFFLGFR